MNQQTQITAWPLLLFPLADLQDLRFTVLEGVSSLHDFLSLYVVLAFAQPGRQVALIPAAAAYFCFFSARSWDTFPLPHACMYGSG